MNEATHSCGCGIRVIAGRVMVRYCKECGPTFVYKPRYLSPGYHTPVVEGKIGVVPDSPIEVPR